MASEFNTLWWKGSTRGYIDMVRPMSFEALCEEERRIRDLEEVEDERDR